MALTFKFVTSHDRKNPREQTAFLRRRACPLSSSDAGMWRMLSVHLIRGFAPGGGSPVSTVWLPYAAQRRQAGRQTDRKRILRAIRWKTWSPREHKRIRHSDDSTSFVLFSKGPNRISGRRVRAVRDARRHPQPLLSARRSHHGLLR